MFYQALSVAKRVDIELRQLINHEWIHPWLDWLMPRISDWGLWFVPILLVALAFLIWGGRRERLLIGLIALSVCIGDMGVVRGVRWMVQRPRPYEALENVRYVTREGVEIRSGSPNTLRLSRGRSMPSAHVCNNTSSAFWITYLYPPWGALSWILLPLMAYSRVYTGSHYPSDTLVSIPLALAYNFIILFLIKSVSPKFPKKA